MDVLIIFSCCTLISAHFDNMFFNVESIPTENSFVLKKKYRPVYHISTADAWLSYPTGFTSYKGFYHLFYQYNQYNGGSGHSTWGHVISTNLIDWVQYPAAVVPKDAYDKQGCLAGTAFEYLEYLVLIYTGVATQNGKSVQTQNIAISGDGMIFRKYLYNPLIKVPPNGTFEFRNPKVWLFRNTWHMIVSISSVAGLTELVLYTSTDLFRWKYHGVIVKSYDDMGFMWETPDVFEIEGRHVVILSVKGIKTDDDDRFQNIHQTGYVIGFFNHYHEQFEDFEVSKDTFHVLDYGHDFYAAKTMRSPDGRILLVAWLGREQADFNESTYGWAGMLTLIREVSINENGRILMTPIREMVALRGEVLEEAVYNPGEAFTAETKHFELTVNSSSVSSDIEVLFEWGSEDGFSIKYSSEGIISIDRGGFDGVRRAYWSPVKDFYLHIFVDYSSIEVFCGEGEVVFSSRIYPQAMKVRIGGDSKVYIVQYKMQRSVRFPKISVESKTGFNII